MHIMILLPNPNKARHMGTKRGRKGCNMFSSPNSQHLKMLTRKLNMPSPPGTTSWADGFNFANKNLACRRNKQKLLVPVIMVYRYQAKNLGTGNRSLMIV
ncbi:unnamed protein product [Musa hybrid cultivar]